MSRRPQRGIALIALMAVIALGASWYMVHRLNAESGRMTAVVRERNAAVLNRAKQALIGYIANDAADSAEKDPGRLPCPEAPGSFNNPSTEGTAAGSCSLTAVGRLPWKTLGLDKLVDASGEPLWYVVSPGWHLLPPGTPATLTINSNTSGQLTVDGVANDSVALIIAPGPTIYTTCNSPAVSQSRPATTGVAPLVQNYLECENAVGTTFVTTGPSDSFNDQVLRVTTTDVLPAIEAAIADRIQRQIVPALKTVFKPTAWGFSGDPVYPYPAPFPTTPTTPSTSNYLGSTSTCSGNTCKGLLPFNQTQGCTASPSNPRCLPTLIGWQGTPAPAVEVYGHGYIQTQSCSWTSGNSARVCSGEYHEDDAQPTQPIGIEMTATFTNVAMGLRALDTSKFTVEARDDTSSGPWLSLTPTYTVTLNNGSAWGKPLGSTTITFGATLPNIDDYGWGTYADFRIGIDRSSISDHSLLDPADATTGWFARNEWYRLTYYAVAPGYTSATLPPSCNTYSTGAVTDCLNVINVTPSGKQRTFLIMAGRSINASSSTLSAAMDASQTTLSVASASGFPPSANFSVNIDSESMLVTAIAGTTFTVSRAQQGTTAAAHSIGAKLTQARPSSTLADYLEFGNNIGSSAVPFESHSVTSAAATHYTDTGTANAYSINANVVVGRPLQFKAANSNLAGASTLSAPGIGPPLNRLLNSDGSDPAAGEIQANAVVEVVYNGTNFVLYKRPFNDRVIVVDSN